MAGAFTYALARALGIGRAGAIVAGLGYMLAGPLLYHAHHTNIVVGVALLPLLLVLMETACRRGTPVVPRLRRGDRGAGARRAAAVHHLRRPGLRHLPGLAAAADAALRRGRPQDLAVTAGGLGAAGAARRAAGGRAATAHAGAGAPDQPLRRTARREPRRARQPADAAAAPRLRQPGHGQLLGQRRPGALQRGNGLPRRRRADAGRHRRLDGPQPARALLPRTRALRLHLRARLLRLALQRHRPAAALPRGALPVAVRLRAGALGRAAGRHGAGGAAAAGGPAARAARGARRRARHGRAGARQPAARRAHAGAVLPDGPRRARRRLAFPAALRTGGDLAPPAHHLPGRRGAAGRRHAGRLRPAASGERRLAPGGSSRPAGASSSSPNWPPPAPTSPR